MAVVVAVSGLAGAVPATGAAAPATAAAFDHVVFWNDVLLESYRQAGGAPGPLARAGAMTFRAMYAANTDQAPSGVVLNRSAAMDAAAYTVLSQVFNRTDHPGVTVDFAAEYAQALADAGAGTSSPSVDFGRRRGEAVVVDRADDGWNDRTPYTLDNGHGAWRPTGGDCDDASDAATPNWGKVRPFVVDGGSQYRPAVPGGATDYAQFINSTTYLHQVDEVRRVGGREDYPANERTPEQTEIAWFWANDLDGTYKPPGQLMEHTRIVAERRGLGQDEKAMLFARVALALADASIAAWDNKFLSPIDLWRPVDAVEHAYLGASWQPLSADRNGNPLTPCFPAWVSGHATFAGAWSGVMQRYFGTDQIGTTPTDRVELTTEDPHATTVPGGGFKTRAFTTFSGAARENALSRLFLGVHYRFDGDRDGLALGDNVAAAVSSSPGLANGLGPTGVVWRDEQHMFTRGVNGTLEHYRYGTDRVVSHDSWGGTIVGNPSAFASKYGGTDQQLHVMARDGEGRLLHYWWDAATPGTIRRDVWAGPRITGDPVGFTWRNEQHVFARGANGTLEHWWFAPGTGVSHNSWGGSIAGNPSGFASAYGGADQQLHVMARDSEGRLLHYWWDAAAPNTIRRDVWAGPRISSDPTGFTWRGEQHVFARGQNGTLEHWWFAPTTGVSHNGWGGYLIGSPSGFASAYDGADQQLHVMARDGEGRLLHYWWDAAAPGTIRRDIWTAPSIVSDPTGLGTPRGAVEQLPQYGGAATASPAGCGSSGVLAAFPPAVRADGRGRSTGGAAGGVRRMAAERAEPVHPAEPAHGDLASAFS
ncbi:hypothetical protein A6A25_39670 [Saccharothrix sp. CB00851]|nr:hypothetical protein A6A25_39670 [Saccharothrix sp. CB00851]